MGRIDPDAPAPYKQSAIVLAAIDALLGLAITSLAPPFALLAALASSDPWLAGLGLLALASIGAAFLPTLRLYGLGPGRALALPLATMLFAAMTVDSAIRYRRGAGGRWQGRVLTPEA